MRKRIRERLTYANVVASLALFAALGGSAYAVKQASVGTKALKDGAVITKKLDRHAVTGKKLDTNSVAARAVRAGAIGSTELGSGAVNAAALANASVTAAKLQDGAVTGGALADDAVTRTKLRAQAVTAPKIADGAVSDRKLADAAVTSTKLAPLIEISQDSPTITDGNPMTATAICPDGTVVVSGGGFDDTFELELTTSIRFGNGWRVQSFNDTGVDQTITARAYCLSAAPAP